MAIRRSHGEPYPEGPRPDGEGLPAFAAVEAEPVERRSDGKLAGSEAARALGRRGGAARHRRARLWDLAGVGASLVGRAASGWSAAESFADATGKELESLTGASPSPVVRSLIGTAALQLMASRLLFAKAAEAEDGDGFVKASRMADASRQTLLVVHEIHAREVARRAEGGGGDGGTATARAALEAIRREAAENARNDTSDTSEGSDT